MDRFQISISPTVAIALCLDDPSMRMELDYQLVRATHTAWTISVTVQSAWTLLWDIDERAEWDGRNDWDQPRSWRYACRKALPVVARSLAAVLPKSKALQLAETIIRNGRLA